MSQKWVWNVFSRRPEASGGSAEKAPSPGLHLAHISRNLLNLWGAVSHCVTSRRLLWTRSSISYLLSSPSSPDNWFNNENKKNLTCLDRMTTWGSRQRELYQQPMFSNSLAGLMEPHSCNWPWTDVATSPQGQEGWRWGWRSYPNSQLFFSGYSLYLFL